MSKVNGSILVICNMPEDEKMYPHLYDVLASLKKCFDDVQYIGSDPRFYPLLEIDKVNFIRSLSADSSEIDRLQLQIEQLEKQYDAIRDDQLNTISSMRLNLKHADRLVIAVDDHAFNCAMQVFPDSTIYWSFDILGSDSSHLLPGTARIAALLKENGKLAVKAKALIVQDKEREMLIKETLGGDFNHVIYLPVALADSLYCRKVSTEREQHHQSKTLNIIQSGHICESRFSLDLLLAFQRWPHYSNLNLRGHIAQDVRETVLHMKRAVSISDDFYDNSVLSEVFNRFDVGFVGYKDKDRNHEFIVNASSQLVAYLRLGMPVICCGSGRMIDFVTRHRIGVAASHPFDITSEQLDFLVLNYQELSRNAREVYGEHFDLERIMSDRVLPALENLMCRKTNKKLLSCIEPREENADAGYSSAEKAGEHSMQQATDRYYSELFIHNEYCSSPEPNDEESARWQVISGMLDMVARTSLAGRPLRILDAGCGRGWMTSLLMRYGSAEGIDPVEPVIQYARSLFPQAGFTAGTPAEQLASDGFSPYDIVVCSEVIEHVKYADQQQFAATLAELLVKGGYLLITTPRAEIFDIWMQITGNNLQPVDDWLTEGMLKQLFLQAGCHNLANGRVYYDMADGSFHGVQPSDEKNRYLALYQVALFKKIF